MKKVGLLLSMILVGQLSALETCVSCLFKIKEDPNKDAKYRIVFDLGDSEAGPKGIESKAQNAFCAKALPSGTELVIAVGLGKAGFKNFISLGKLGNTYDVAEGLAEAGKKSKNPQVVHLVGDAFHPSTGSVSCNAKNAARFAKQAGQVVLKVGGVVVEGAKQVGIATLALTSLS